MPSQVKRNVYCYKCICPARVPFQDFSMGLRTQASWFGILKSHTLYGTLQATAARGWAWLPRECLFQITVSLFLFLAKLLQLKSLIRSLPIKYKVQFKSTHIFTVAKQHRKDRGFPLVPCCKYMSAGVIPLLICRPRSPQTGLSHSILVKLH